MRLLDIDGAGFGVTWVVISDLNCGPRTAESQNQFEGAMVAQLYASDLFIGTVWWQLNNIQQEQPNILFTEDLDEVDLFLAFNAQRQIAQRRANLLRTFQMPVDGNTKLLR